MNNSGGQYRAVLQNDDPKHSDNQGGFMAGVVYLSSQSLDLYPTQHERQLPKTRLQHRPGTASPGLYGS